MPDIHDIEDFHLYVLNSYLLARLKNTKHSARLVFDNRGSYYKVSQEPVPKWERKKSRPLTTEERQKLQRYRISRQEVSKGKNSSPEVRFSLVRSPSKINAGFGEPRQVRIDVYVPLAKPADTVFSGQVKRESPGQREDPPVQQQHILFQSSRRVTNADNAYHQRFSDSETRFDTTGQVSVHPP